MTDFIAYIEETGKKYGIDDPDFNMNLSRFLVSNKWFGCVPEISGECLLVKDEDLHRLGQKINDYCSMYGMSTEEKKDRLINEICSEMPKTGELYKRYIADTKLEEESAYYIAAFLLRFLSGEIDESTDKEIRSLLDDGFIELSLVYGEILTDFINWIHRKTITAYRNVYSYETRSNRTEESSAYDPNSYLKIMYHLFNETYIRENDMYQNAARSRKYVDTWLYLALHFLCALRNTDLQRLPHPTLTERPETVLKRIEEDTFTADSSKAVLYSVEWGLDALMLTPNKTAGTTGVGTLKFHVPTSAETHIGILFAAAEAHFQIAGESSDKPLIKVITKYEQISKYMGEEIGELFFESDFRSRSANKSYLQMMHLLTDEIDAVNDEFHVKGYMLAALARSHKGSYGTFAQTTATYLKDAKMNGFSAEFVAKELFERGVLSMIPSMLLKMIEGDEFDKSSITKQTQIIQELDMSPAEVESTVAMIQVNMQRSKDLVKAMYNGCTKQEILNALHKIGNGEAVSKNDSCYCLQTAMGKMCPFAGRRNCIGCEYEISTKITMLLLVREYQRLTDEYKSADNKLEKNRYKEMAKTVVIPRIEEMLSIIKETYGDKAEEELEAIIKEVRNGK